MITGIFLIGIAYLTCITSAINQSCTPEGFAAASVGGTFHVSSSCPTNSKCLANGFCACEKGFIGDCSHSAYSMQSGVAIDTKVSNRQYTLFEIIGDSQEYTLLSFNLCHNSSSDFMERIQVWDDDGVIQTFSKDNAQPGGKDYAIREGCIALTTPFMLFGTKTNGQTEGFILGLKLSSQGELPLTLTVSIQLLDFWGLMTKLLLIIGGCFFLTLSLAIAYLVYKWRRRQLFYLASTQKDLSHFEQFMPKVKMNQQELQSIQQNLCAVCLIQFGDSWLRKTICGHLFHQECLDEWCKTNLSCPICRKSFELAQLKGDISTDDVTLRSSGLRENILE